MKKLYIFPLIACLFFNVLFAEDISVEHTEKINALLKKVFRVDKPEAIEYLSGGFSSPGLYKITVDGKPYVVRFSNKKRSLEDRLRELDAMQIAAKSGIAPNIIYGDPVDGVTIMEFLSPTKINSLQEENLKLLGNGIRKIHDGPDFKETFSVFKVAHFFEGAIKGERPAVLNQASEVLNKLEVALKDLLIKKPCHNDLNPNNIIYSKGAIYFVDWEAAGQDDPFFDLATPIVLNNMNDKQQKTLLNVYFKRDPLPEEMAKLEKMKQVSLIYYGFALVCVSQIRGEGLLNNEEVEALSSPDEILKRDIRSSSPKEIQQLGFALILMTLEMENKKEEKI